MTAPSFRSAAGAKEQDDQSPASASALPVAQDERETLKIAEALEKSAEIRGTYFQQADWQRHAQRRAAELLRARAALSAATPPAAVPQWLLDEYPSLAAAPQPAGTQQAVANTDHIRRVPGGAAFLRVAAGTQSDTERDAALLEAVDTLLETAPCECSDKRRYERGEHLTGCYLFDLNIARAAMGNQSAGKEKGE